MAAGVVAGRRPVQLESSLQHLSERVRESILIRLQIFLQDRSHDDGFAVVRNEGIVLDHLVCENKRDISTGMTKAGNCVFRAVVVAVEEEGEIGVGGSVGQREIG